MEDEIEETAYGVLSVIGGSVHVGTDDAVTPTSAKAPLGAGWTELGRYSEDGFTMNRERSTTQHKDQYGEVAIEVVSESGLTYKVKFIETSNLTREMFNHTTVAQDGTQVIVPSAPGVRRRFCLNAILANAAGRQFVERTYIPDGQVVDTEDAARKNGELANYGLTIRAFPAAELVDPETGLTGSAKVMLTPSK